MIIPKNLFAALFFIFASASTASAQLMVEEGKVRLNVAPNQTIMDTLVVRNTSNQPVQAKVYWEDFIYVPPFNGEKDFFPAGAGKFSCAGWINFLPREFTIPAYGRQNIDYTIKVPADVKGGHYGILFFENSAVQAAPGNIGVNTVTRVGSLFFLETNSKNKSSRTDNWQVTDKGFSARFVNDGDVFLLPQGVYYVLAADGMAVSRGDIAKVYLPPGEGTDFTISLPHLKPGQYLMVITFDLEDEVSKVVELDFTADANSKLKINQIRN
jgi:hypothetical protein